MTRKEAKRTLHVYLLSLSEEFQKTCSFAALIRVFYGSSQLVDKKKIVLLQLPRSNLFLCRSHDFSFAISSVFIPKTERDLENANFQIFKKITFLCIIKL